MNDRKLTAPSKQADFQREEELLGGRLMWLFLPSR
jgi:hypothetical protein